MSWYPQSAWHDGQDFVSASGPLYHSLINTSQPRIVLQHLVAITGGLMVINSGLESISQDALQCDWKRAVLCKGHYVFQ